MLCSTLACVAGITPWSASWCVSFLPLVPGPPNPRQLALCRCVCDLAVGSLALQDPPSCAHGAHVTFSAKQELSGWQAPAAAGEEEEQSQFTAAGTRPRLFVVFEDISGYEVLDQDLFTAYAQRKVRLKSCPRLQPCMEGAMVKGTASTLKFLFDMDIALDIHPCCANCHV